MGQGLWADVAHQVHLVQQVEVDGEIVETIDLTPYTGDGFTTSNATARTGYIFTHWSTSAVQDFANRDPWGRAFEQVAFSLYETMTNTAHYVRADLDADGDGMPDGLELYWYGDLDETPASDTDGDGIGFARELEQGTNPHFPDAYARGLVGVSAKPQFFKLIRRCEPAGALFATVTNNVAPGVAVTTAAYSPATSDFAHWTATGAAVETRDVFGRALDRLAFAMPTNDVELVAVCCADADMRQSLYWYGNETTEPTSDTDGDGFTFAEEIRQGTNPLFADCFTRGIVSVSAKPQFFKLTLRCEPEGALFATVTNNVAPGVAVTTAAYSPATSDFAHWTATGVAVATRDVFGRALDRLSFAMPTNDVELVAVCRTDAATRQSLYWYGNETTEPTSDTDGDGLSFAEEVRQGTNPLFADRFTRGLVGVSAKPQFFRLIRRCEPEGALFATVTNNVAPGVAITTAAGSPTTSDFAHWTATGAAVATRDVFGRALDRLTFAMPTNDVELVAVCRADADLRQSLYWYGNETTEPTSDTDGDGLSFAEEIRQGTNPLFADRFNRGLVGVSAKPQFFRLVLRCEPEGALFATVTNNVAPGVAVTTAAYSPATSDFAHWTATGAAVATRDVFGRALDRLAFAMPTNDVELVAVCRADADLRQSLYWYGNETTEPTSDTDGDGFTFAEEIRQGTNPLFADTFSRGVIFALSEELEADLQPFEQMRGAIVGGEYAELFTSGLAGNAGTSATFGENACPLAVDVDGDGLFDLIVVSRGGLQIFLNKGSAANPDFTPTTPGDAWANFQRLLNDMARPLVCTANGVFYVSDGGGPIYAFTLADGTLVDTGLVGIPGVLDGRLFALTTAGTLAADGWTLTLDTPVIGGVSVSTADIDADGRTDLLVSDAVGHIWLYRNVTAAADAANGAWRFKLLHKVWAGTGVGFAEGMTISLIDWDDDGDQDVLIGTPDGKLMLLRDPRTGRPTNVRAYPGADNVLLTWDPNSQPRIRGYNVYRAPDAESFARIANQTPLPRYRDRPGVLRDYWYRVTSVSRFYTSGNSTPTTSESLPTDAVYVQFRPSVWLNDASGFTGSNVTVIVSMNNSMGISAEGLSLTFAYDPAVLAPRGIRTTGLTAGLAGGGTASVPSAGTWRFASQGGEIATGAGRFLLLDFAILPVHDVTETTVTLTAATVKALDGRAVALDLPQSAKVEISDSDPLVPAIVAVHVADAAVDSETEFELPVTDTATETLTNFTATVTWDETLLELRGVQTGFTGLTGLSENLVNPVNPVKNSYAFQTSGGDFALKFYAKDPASAATNFAARVSLTDVAAVDCHGFAVSAADATGTVLIKNAHPWVPARVSVTTEDRKVDTLEEVTVPFKVTSDAALTQGTFTVEWDDAVLELKGIQTGLDGDLVNPVNPVKNSYTLQTSGGDFALTFVARDQHDVTMAQVRLVAATVTDAPGFPVAPSVPVVATILVHDAHPLVPAQVAMTLDDVRAMTETEFEMTLAIASTEALTNLVLALDYDTELLELRSGVLNYANRVPSTVTLRFYAKENHTADATVVTVRPQRGFDHNGLAAVLPTEVTGTVVLADSNPWQPAAVSVGVGNVSTETGLTFEVPVTLTATETLTNFAATVEWDADVLELRGVQTGLTGLTGLGENLVNPVNPVKNSYTLQTTGSGFTLTFYAKEQYWVSNTVVSVVAAEAVDNHGLTAHPIAVPVSGTVYLQDLYSLHPAEVAMALTCPMARTMEEFDVKLAITTTEALTNLTLAVDYDEAVLELRSAQLTYVGSVPDEVTLRFYAKEQHDVASTVIAVVPSDGIDCHERVAKLPARVEGVVALVDSNPWQPATVSVGVGSASVDTRTSFEIPVTVTATETLTNFAATVTWDDDVLELRGCSTGLTGLTGSDGNPVNLVNPVKNSCVVQTAGGGFALTFYAKDQHTVTRTSVRLTGMAAVDAHGLVANPIADATGTVMIRDAHPLVPAGVVLNVSTTYADTLSEFTVPIPVTSTKALTNLSFTVGWDASVLELRGASGGAFLDGVPSAGTAKVGAKGTVPRTLYLTFYAKDQHAVTETTLTLAHASAQCIDGLAANVTTVDGTVHLTDANVPVPVEMTVAVHDAKVKSGESFKMLVGATASGDLAELTVDVDWDASLLTFVGSPAAQRVTTLADNKRRFVFACTGNYNLFNLDFTAVTIPGLRTNAWARLVGASGVGRNGLAAVVKTALPRTGNVMIVREVGKYDPGDVDGDGVYTAKDLLILNGYVVYLSMLKAGGANFANSYADGYRQRYGVDVRLTGAAARAADVNCDGVVNKSDIRMLESLIAEAEGAGK